MNILKKVDGRPDILLCKCPGCDYFHQIWVGDEPGVHPRWQFNGDFERPTFSPSLLVQSERWAPPVTPENVDEWRGNPWAQEKVQHICHSFIRDGHWEFLTDCTHSLAGKRVPMIEAK